jgi:predicted nucleic acid-binding protein
VIILDTSGLITAYGRDQVGAKAVLATLRSESGPRVLSPFVLAELDAMIASRLGVSGELMMLADVAGGVYRLADFSVAAIDQARSVVNQYSDLNIGLADASIVVLAARYQTTRVLTFDHRHFRAMKPLQGGTFTILPADATPD